MGINPPKKQTYEYTPINIIDVDLSRNLTYFQKIIWGEGGKKKKKETRKKETHYEEHLLYTVGVTTNQLIKFIFMLNSCLDLSFKSLIFFIHLDKKLWDNAHHITPPRTKIMFPERTLLSWNVLFSSPSRKDIQFIYNA